jgi:type IV pilus assembly protein PilA
MKKQRSFKQQVAGFSLIELLIVIVIIGILAAISVPSLISSKRAANTSSAVASMRVITSAEELYSKGISPNKNYGLPEQLFQFDLIDSALAGSCVPTPTMASVSGLAAPAQFAAKAGFVFNFAIDNTDAGNPAFTVLAKPRNTMGTAREGDRTFFLDQSGVIRASSSAAQLADSASAPIN